MYSIYNINIYLYINIYIYLQTHFSLEESAYHYWKHNFEWFLHHLRHMKTCWPPLSASPLLHREHHLPDWGGTASDMHSFTSCLEELGTAMTTFPSTLLFSTSRSGLHFLMVMSFRAGLGEKSIGNLKWMSVSLVPCSKRDIPQDVSDHPRVKI